MGRFVSIYARARKTTPRIDRIVSAHAIDSWCFFTEFELGD